MDPTSQNQDLLTLRTFIGAANYALNDQSYAGIDGMVYNPPGQFVTAGPYATSVEGQPIQLSGGVRLSPGLTLVLLAVGAYWLATRKG